MWTGRYFSYPRVLSLCSYKGCLLPPFFLCHYTISVSCGFVAVVCPYMLYLLSFIWFGVQGGKSTHSCARRPCVFAAVVWEVWLLCLSVCALMGKPRASEQGWKTASSTAQLPFWVQVGQFWTRGSSSARFFGPLFFILAI